MQVWKEVGKDEIAVRSAALAFAENFVAVVKILKGAGPNRSRVLGASSVGIPVGPPLDVSSVGARDPRPLAAITSFDEREPVVQ